MNKRMDDPAILSICYDAQPFDTNFQKVSLLIWRTNTKTIEIITSSNMKHSVDSDR